MGKVKKEINQGGRIYKWGLGIGVESKQGAAKQVENLHFGIWDLAWYVCVCWNWVFVPFVPPLCGQMFSSCSKESILRTIETKAPECFKERNNKVCGNSRVDEGEECDPGLLHQYDDPCCTSDCKLKQNATCRWAGKTLASFTLKITLCLWLQQKNLLNIFNECVFLYWI